MEAQEKLTTQQFIISRLHNLQMQIEKNDYVGALESIREVKAADSKNIYVIAIEKQIAKLNDKILSQSDKIEVVESLPAMIERAINDAQRRSASQPKITEQKAKEKDQKEIALEKLKTQYIQRAAEYIEKQEYQHALEEVKRIYIIEPASKVAKEYERKIVQMMELQAREEKRAAEEKPVEEMAVSKVTVSRETEETIATKESDFITEKKVDLLLEEEPAKSKLPLYIGIAVAVIIIGAVVFYIFTRKLGEAQMPQTEQAPSAIQKDTSLAASENLTASAPVSGSTSTKTNTSVKPEKDSKTAKAMEKSEAKTSKPVQEQKPVTVEAETKKPSSTTEKKLTETTTSPPTETAKTPESEIPQVFVPIESPPKIVKRENPIYPDFAIKLGLEGKVVVEVTIDPQGRPIQAKIKKSDNEIFNDAAINAAMKSTYEPGMMSTGPVTASILVPFNFKLKR